MRKFDVVIKTDIGHLSATLESPTDIPTGLLLQAVMSHQQLLPHLIKLGANGANTLLVNTPSRMDLRPGFTIVFHDGVSMNGPLNPSPVENVPRAFDGVQLTYGLRAEVNYLVNPDGENDDTGEYPEYEN